MTGEEVTASGLIVIRYGWSRSIAMISAHYVWPDMPVRYRNGRPLADSVCGYPAHVDEEGHAAAEYAIRCGECTRYLRTGVCGMCRGEGRVEVPAHDGQAFALIPCELCHGSCRLPKLPPDSLP